ncbi:hypothetical protein [Mucilaginibacter sp.]|uniref:hypothetical protein n=1 Tax=Mucilaginibacter sp. TaxID=1882438 RepID=UPI003D0CA465
MKITVLSLFCFFLTQLAFAQTTTPGPAEIKITDSICNCISRVDMSKIQNKKEAYAVFTDCFTQHSALLIEVAEERKISISDDAEMNKLGTEIGTNLLKQNCSAALKLGMKMSDDKSGEATESSTQGVVKRIDLKGFNYIVITENGAEKSFLWLRQFTGSEEWMNGTAKLIGKKVKITWQEIEVYLPQAKGYYKVKEITAITIL